jgi:hypothetical protein|tara:strand:- start:667 stop:834 length:168 start_codon:yes stop_codon:yes gene_type:complete
VFFNKLLFFRATAPIITKAYIEKIFLTPEGNLIVAVCVNILTFTKKALVPGLRAY